MIFQILLITAIMCLINSQNLKEFCFHGFAIKFTQERSHWGGGAPRVIPHTPPPPPPPNFNFSTKERLTATVSNTRDAAFNECSEIIRTTIITIFNVYAWLFIFCNYIGEMNHFMLDLLKRSNT